MTRKMVVLAALGGLLLVGGGVAAGTWMYSDGITQEVDADAKVAAAEVDEAPEKLVRQAAPIYYTFDPAFTVNLKGSDAVAQIGVSASTHFASTDDALKNDDPALRSTVLAILADATPDMADSDQGKQQMLARLTGAINHRLVQDGYGGNVDGVFFTDFVVQAGEDDQGGEGNDP